MALHSLTLPQLLAVYRIPKDCVLLYEREGLISPWRVGEERHYTARDQIRIEVILKGKKLGFALREIKSLIEAHLPKASASTASRDRRELQIEQLEKEKAELQAAIERLRARPDIDGSA